MSPFPPPEAFLDLLRLARQEDLGDQGDVTSRLMVDEDALGVGTVVQRAVGVACGLPAVEHVCRLFDERLRVEWIPGFHLGLIECRYSESRQTPLVRLRGPLRSLLAVERTLLNLLSRLSGIATLTHRYVRRVEGIQAAIFDTRKTTPGLRALEKYAVRCGGGHNHRFGLHDAVLIKDNHLAGLPPPRLAEKVAAAVQQSRHEDPRRTIEVEVDTIDQLRHVLAIDRIDVILLDNMDCPTMARCVQLRDELTRSPGRQMVPALEASGGVTLETVRDIALTGVERIAVGALTHSAPAVDIAIDIEEA